jgi:hypothetical protein
MFSLISCDDILGRMVVCDCGREFFVTEKAVAHVLLTHLDVEQRKDRVLSRDTISKMLSPNPLVKN